MSSRTTAFEVTSNARGRGRLPRLLAFPPAIPCSALRPASEWEIYRCDAFYIVGDILILRLVETVLAW